MLMPAFCASLKVANGDILGVLLKYSTKPNF